MKYLTIVFGLVLAFAAMADGYDPHSGSTYYKFENSDGSTSVRGFNNNTGSTWSTEIEPDGSQRGFDSNGDYWRYNDDSGLYINHGTGQTCVRGYCNK